MNRKENEMDKTKLTVGIILILIACGLLAANIVLPAEKLMFTVGDMNIPYLPPIILGVMGVLFMVSASKGPAKKDTEEIIIDEEKAALNKRLETVAWGLFLIMLGGFAFVPHEVLPKGAWSLGVGIIMLGLNAFRYMKGIKMSGFTTFLGVVSIISGTLQLMGLNNLEGPILLIILGAYVLVKPTIDEKKLFGKAEEK